MPKARTTRVTACWARTRCAKATSKASASPSGRPTPTIRHRHRRFQSVGPHQPPHAASRRRRVGTVHPGAGPRHALQILRALTRRAKCKRKPTPTRSSPKPRRARASIVWGLNNHTWADQAWMEARGHRNLHARARLDLRSASRILDAPPLARIAQLPRTGRPPGHLRARSRLHAPRIDAHHGASLLRLLGLSGHRLLRAHFALRHSR